MVFCVACKCMTCRAFAKDLPHHWPKKYGKDGVGVEFWSNPKGPCGLCNEDKQEHLEFVPQVFAEFLTDRVCGSCRNSVNFYVQRLWGLCWLESPDWALKWAMVDWVSWRITHHIHHSEGPVEFWARTCCETDHNPTRRRWDNRFGWIPNGAFTMRQALR